MSASRGRCAVHDGADGQSEAMGRVVTKRRTFPISRARLFDLWTEPGTLRPGGGRSAGA